MKKFSQSYVSQVGPIALSFIALPVIYSAVPIEDIGRYESTILMGGILIIFGKLSLPSVYFRDKLTGSISPKNIIRLIEVLCGLLFSLFIIGLTLSVNDQNILESVYYLSVISLILIETLKKDIQSDENYSLAIKIFITSAILVQGLKILFVLNGHASYAALLSADILLHLFYMLVYFVYRRKILKVSHCSPDTRGLLDFDKKYWLTLYAHHVLSFINQHLSKILVLVYLSSVDMAILALSIRILLPISFSVDALIYWLSPLIFKGKVRLTFSHVLIVVSAGLFLLISAEIFYETFFLMFFPEEYIASKQIFMVLILAQTFNVIYRMSAIKILASANIVILLKITIINLFTTMSLIYFIDFDFSLILVASVAILQSLIQVFLIYAYDRYNSQPA